MGVQTKRTRSTVSPYAVTPLDLTDADAADRRLDVLSPGDANASGTRFLGFSWTKSTAQATDIQVYRIDAADSDRLYLLEALLGDTGTSGHWRPDEEEVAGMDVQVPSESKSVGWRIQFSQAGGACDARVTADFKGV